VIGPGIDARLDGGGSAWGVVASVSANVAMLATATVVSVFKPGPTAVSAAIPRISNRMTLSAASSSRRSPAAITTLDNSGYSYQTSAGPPASRTGSPTLPDEVSTVGHLESPVGRQNLDNDRTIGVVIVNDVGRG
jgi:hypothetical protein